jgi:hypothetical protein
MIILNLLYKGTIILLGTFKSILTAHIVADVASQIYHYLKNKSNANSKP